MARRKARAHVFADRASRDGLHILRGFLFFVVLEDDECRPADGVLIRGSGSATASFSWNLMLKILKCFSAGGQRGS